MPKHTDDKPRRRRVMKEFSISEISLVDNPAQPDARIALMKRDDGAGEPVLKNRRALTTPDAGHTHSIVLADGISDIKLGQTSEELDERGQLHSHPFLVNDAGQVEVGMASGHMHGVAMVVKAATDEDADRLVKREFSSEERERLAQHIKTRARALGLSELLPEEGELATLLGKGLADDGQNPHNPNLDTAHGGGQPHEEPEMTEKNDQTAGKPNDEAVQKELTEAKARAERAERIVKLSPDQREHFDGLSGQEAEDFLAKSSDERDAVLKNLRDADPVVYKDLDGNEYRKSAGEVTLRLVKQNDDLRKQAARNEAIAKRADLEKRAGDLFKNLRGDATAKGALLGAVESIEDEAVRGQVTEMLKAHDAGLGKAFERQGTSSAPTEGETPADKLDALAKQYAERHDVDTTTAYSKVLETDEGKRIYAEHIGRR